MVFFTKEVHCSLCHRGMEFGAPARTRTSNLRLRTATCRTLTPRELKLRHAGAAQVLAHGSSAVWKTPWTVSPHASGYINDVKWWLNSVSRRTLLGFSEALICLSYSALKWSLHEVTLLDLSIIGRLLCF